jgi:hypothetical protein
MILPKLFLRHHFDKLEAIAHMAIVEIPERLTVRQEDVVDAVCSTVQFVVIAIIASSYSSICFPCSV